MYVLQDDAFNYLHHARAYLISHAMGPPNIKALMLLFLEEKKKFLFQSINYSFSFHYNAYISDLIPSIDLLVR